MHKTLQTPLPVMKCCVCERGTLFTQSRLDSTHCTKVTLTTPAMLTKHSHKHTQADQLLCQPTHMHINPHKQCAHRPLHTLPAAAILL